ncbi:unnamed protein product [Vicia faba]|uniref:1-acylglycerol-3-phosphate O-acyltransferase n=1 Tax=Vicia faba TaxID=3906 RepID=A0AAV0Z409_VICFA|nr:unnamed protein product [Vicia faba]
MCPNETSMKGVKCPNEACNKGTICPIESRGLEYYLTASGLIVNLIQATCFVILRPLSKNFYRRINRFVAEFLWLELVWIVDWWAGVKIQVFTEPETFRLMGKEHALVISNHKSDIDWLVGWIIAQRSGCLGSTLAVMKKSSKFLPDESTLKSGLQELRDFPLPFWLALFVEGTRFTQAKLSAVQEYAASTGFPVPRNVLILRTKGFISAVSHMRSFVPAVYDVTVAIPKSSPSPTMLRLFQRQPSVVHVHVKRHLMKEFPEADEDVAQWCRDIFVAKDDLLDKHIADDKFSDHEPRDLGRPIKSLLGVAFTVFSLAIVTALMQIMIMFTQSERSNPAKVSPSKPKRKKNCCSAAHASAHAASNAATKALNQTTCGRQTHLPRHH